MVENTEVMSCINGDGNPIENHDTQECASCGSARRKAERQPYRDQSEFATEEEHFAHCRQVRSGIVATGEPEPEQPEFDRFMVCGPTVKTPNLDKLAEKIHSAVKSEAVPESGEKGITFGDIDEIMERQRDVRIKANAERSYETGYRDGFIKARSLPDRNSQKTDPMKDDQLKKYEEAAKEHTRTHLSFHSDPSAAQGESFFMGCEFASQDTEERVKQAHNEAIDKVLACFGPEFDERESDLYEEIQKLKL